MSTMRNAALDIEINNYISTYSLLSEDVLAGGSKAE